MMTPKINVVLVLVYFTGHISGQLLYTDKKSNYERFLSLYSTTDGNTTTTDLIAKKDMSSAMTVNISMVLHALFDFDEVSGTLEMSTSVKLSWYDEMVQIFYGTSDYTTVYTLTNTTDATTNTLLVRYNRLWTPKLVLGNAVEEFSRIGDTAYMCRYNLETGLVSWQPKFLLKSTCTADVTYYPFDQQDCVFTILAWGYTTGEVILSSTRGTWDMSVYEGNGEWDVVDTRSRSYVNGEESVFELAITLNRNPLYFAFNIIIPVLALSALNGAVFWLPVDSGERVGFSITCFLTFMVLLTTILGYLPPTSSTMSFLCYYVVVMMLFSGLLTTFVILNLHIYHKDEKENVPSCLKMFIRFWRFRWLTKLCKRKVSDTDGQSGTSETPVIRDAERELPKQNKSSKIVLSGKLLSKLESKHMAWTEPDEDKTKDDEEVTWKDLSQFLDKFLFITFLSAEAFFSITFLVPLAHRQ